MNSMTGYGKGVAEENGITLTIELKSVNNRYLEINSRLPKALSAFEDVLRREIQGVIKRGSVDIFFNIENNSKAARPIFVDEGLAQGYINAAQSLSERLSVANDLTVSHLMRIPDIIKIEPVKDDPDVLERLFLSAVKDALKNLLAMRFNEGDGIKQNLSELLENLIKYLAEVSSRAPKIVEEYKLKLEARIKELLKSVEIDEARLSNEAAYYADKSDINEEISRLNSHIAQFKQTLESDEQQGRKLDFISQEMNREINTIGSKSGDTELTSYVVAMKNELEKIKEQIRNVE